MAQDTENIIPFDNGVIEESISPKSPLFEYYDMLSHPKDSDILGNWEVWVYGSDREAYTPHCHIRTKNGSLEFEVSLLTWEVINIKNSKLPNSWVSIDRKLKKAFFEWLDRPSVQDPSKSNKFYMYRFWDGANPKNPLEKWVDSKKNNIDKDLVKYINPPKVYIDLWKLHSQITSKLTPIYMKDRDRRYELHQHSPSDLLKILDIDVDIDGNKEAEEMVAMAENEVYVWTS